MCACVGACVCAQCVRVRVLKMKYMYIYRCLFIISVKLEVVKWVVMALTETEMIWSRVTCVDVCKFRETYKTNTWHI